MKKQKLFILFSFAVLCLTGCSKTEKDNSFDTDLYGTYSDNLNASNMDYVKEESYILNKDNLYEHIVYEKYNDNILRDSKIDDKIGNIYETNSDITEIELNNGNSFEITLYKYKNMLGRFYETDVPSGKTFDLFLKNEDSSVNEGLVFNKDGKYHYCTNYDNCTDDSSTFTKYKHKDDYIYQADSDGNWTILLYVVDDGLFAKEYTKTEE
ncbi:MAG: hypothetical protein ACLR0A_17675 [Faecalibacillus intestinalis]